MGCCGSKAEEKLCERPPDPERTQPLVDENGKFVRRRVLATKL